MKLEFKALLACIAGLLIAGASTAPAIASTAETTVEARVAVAPVFRLEVAIPGKEISPMVDFGEVMRGEKYSEKAGAVLPQVQVTCYSSLHQEWSLQATAANPLSSADANIPFENFTCRAKSTNGRGTLTSNSVPITNAPRTLYVSTTEEGFNLPEGTKVNIEWDVKIPDDQAAGTYNAGIIFVMTTD